MKRFLIHFKKKLKDSSMKYSMKHQMIVMFVGMTAAIFTMIFVINACLLKPYYIYNKQHEFVGIYEKMQEGLMDGNTDLEAVAFEINDQAERTNISYVISDSVQGKAVSNMQNMDRLQTQLVGQLFAAPADQGKILKQTANYTIVQMKDDFTQTEYITMWGMFPGGSMFLMRSPLESIQESVAVSNRFLLIIGVVVLAFGAVAVWFLTKKLTDPLMELAGISNKMADLDFETKYTSGGNNEIGLLGANFNRMSEKLEQTISELKTANNQLQKDIERKDKLEEMRTELLGNVSHELKTPIALIQGYAEGLKDEVNEDAASREFYCDVIIDESQKMNQLVRNLLTLNQMEFGAQEIEFTRVNLTAVISGVLQSMEIVAQQKEAKIIFDEKTEVYAWADEYKVEQVVRNYISNAFNHLDGENVVEVRILPLNDKVRISVFNTGSSIPEEALPCIWDKFYKVDKAHTREYGGNGIGLSIVKAIMESFRQPYGVKNYDNGVEFWCEFEVQ